MTSKKNHWGIFVSRVYSVLFVIILSMTIARAQEPLVIKPGSCSSLIKTTNSLAHYQSELLLAQARFNLHCGKTPRFHAYDESTCNAVETKIEAMQKVLSVCAPLVQSTAGANAAALITEPVSPPPFKPSGG
jgi:hypothetical protein